MKRLPNGKVIKCCGECPVLCDYTIIYCALLDDDYCLKHELDYKIVDEELVASVIGMKICRYCPLPDEEVGE